MRKLLNMIIFSAEREQFHVKTLLPLRKLSVQSKCFPLRKLIHMEKNLFEKGFL